jgi:toxin ParE1/3/4
MPRKITPSPESERDLEGLIDYFDERSAELAGRFLDAVRRTYDFLIANPEVGQICQFRDPQAVGMRVWQVDGFRNYLIFYRPTQYLHFWRNELC